MGWDELENHWPDLQRRVRRHWSRLSDEDLARIAGSREALIECLEERYGFSQEAAEREAEAWIFCVRAEQTA